jgi:apolipoprotein N-acyltransferase
LKVTPERRGKKQVTRLLETRVGRITAAAIGAALLYFALKLTPFWPAAWLAPIPLLLVAFHAPSREASLLVWFAAAIGVSSNLTYYLQTTGPIATAVILILQILAWGFYVNRTRSVVRNSQSWTVVFVFPALMAAIDTLVSRFSPHGTAGSFAYTQMDFLPAIQIASVLGAPSIVFLVGLFASTAAIAIYHGPRIHRPSLAYGIPAALIVLALGFGELRLHPSTDAPLTRVGLIAVDEFINPPAPPERAEAVWRAYADGVTHLATQGARIVVLPEKIAALTPGQSAARQRDLASLAQRTGVYLVVGVQRNGDNRKDNASWLFTPQGDPVAEYHKHHLVPYLESDLTPGNEYVVRIIQGAPYGMAICRDLLFVPFGRGYGRLGVSALLVPARDFGRDAWMASAMATLRGVENGYAVIRASRESYLNVSDRYGNIAGRARSAPLPGATLLAEVPLGPATPTIYARTGNIFGWLCFAASICSFFVGPKSRIAIQ